MCNECMKAAEAPLCYQVPPEQVGLGDTFPVLEWRTGDWVHCKATTEPVCNDEHGPQTWWCMVTYPNGGAHYAVYDLESKAWESGEL